MRKARIVHVLFDIGVIGKGIDGLLEIIGGALLFFVKPAQLYQIVVTLTQHELNEDPNDRVVSYLLETFQHLSADTKLFGSIYLLGHGVIKVALVTALLLKFRWAYLAAILAFLLFIVYQLYRYAYTGSPMLVVLSFIDAFVVVITWLEYKRLRAADAFRSE